MTNSSYVFIEAIRNTFFAGGAVMLPILLTGVIGFYCLYRSWFRIGSDFFRADVSRVVETLREDLSSGSGDSIEIALTHLKNSGGIIAREMRICLEIVKGNEESFEDFVQVRRLKTIHYMEKGCHVISVMAAAAPLFGLLGTVTGMVATFETITLYGNQNPVLMADGISEALISTQSGLLVAFPLTLLKERLDERIDMIQEQMKLGITIIKNFTNPS